MEVWSHRLIGLAIAVAGCAPISEILLKGSFLWRGAPTRTTRQQDPVGYWGAVVATTMLAIIAVAVGVAVFAGVIQP
jgi:hypothetical protein